MPGLFLQAYKRFNAHGWECIRHVDWQSDVCVPTLEHGNKLMGGN